MQTRCKVLLPKKRARDRDVWEDRILPVPVVGLLPGEMSSGEFVMTVHDKKNRVVIVIIPVTWTSDRKLAMGTDIMVQAALPDFCALPDNMEGDRKAYTFLRGFIQAWGSPDPGAVAAMEYQNSLFLAQMKEKQQKEREEATRSADHRDESDGTVREEITGSPVKSKTGASEKIPVKIQLWSTGATEPVVWQARVEKSWVDKLCKEAQNDETECVYLTRGGRRIAVGEARIVNGKIDIHFASKVDIRPDDDIDTVEEVN